MPIGTPLETGSMRRLYELDEDQPEPLDFQPSTRDPSAPTDLRSPKVNWHRPESLIGLSALISRPPTTPPIGCISSPLNRRPC